jgi:D-3-phosphoglycerate dehydrogenase / 2-oxoglutarate reductase
VSEERCLVIAADKISASGLETLTSDDRFQVVMANGWEESRLLEALAHAHGLIVRSATTVTRELIDAAPDLRVIGRAGVGVDNIDLDAATERGIPVINAPEGNTVSAAELSMALILSLARNVSSADRSVRAGEWARSRFAGQELRGKTLALIGAGRIGGEVAKRAHGFGMKTVAYDPYLTDERARDLGLYRVTFEEALERADILSLHVPLTPQTQGMIGAKELEMMKSSAFLVNAARGGVVDERALVDALESATIAGAALDVYDEEPLPEASPLREAPNLVLTPHLGASTAEAQELVATEIAAGVKAALMNGDLSRALNAPAIGGEALRKLRPLLDLAESLGRVAGALVDGGMSRVEVRVAGSEEEGLKPLAASALVGVLEHAVGSDTVNYVNSHHLAEQRGIRITTAILPRRSAYTQFIDVQVDAEGRGVRVCGALLGEQNHPRIVRIDHFQLSVEPRGTLIVLRNRDVPGVFGRVGSLLGELGINIREYMQARIAAGGEAIAAVVVDGHVGADLLAEIRSAPDVLDARVVALR